MSTTQLTRVTAPSRSLLFVTRVGSWFLILWAASMTLSTLVLLRPFGSYPYWAYGLVSPMGRGPGFFASDLSFEGLSLALGGAYAAGIACGVLSVRLLIVIERRAWPEARILVTVIATTNVIWFLLVCYLSSGLPIYVANAGYLIGMSTNGPGADSGSAAVTFAGVMIVIIVFTGFVDLLVLGLWLGVLAAWWRTRIARETPHDNSVERQGASTRTGLLPAVAMALGLTGFGILCLIAAYRARAVGGMNAAGWRLTEIALAVGYVVTVWTIYWLAFCGAVLLSQKM